MQEAWRKILQEEARRLSGASRPVSVTRICNELGISIRRSHGLGTSARLLVKDNRFEILLGCSEDARNSLTARERFLVAHEVGHSVLERKHLQKPLGTSEYWQVEELCDSFARWLLLPRERLQQAVRSSVCELGSRLRLTLYLQSVWRVPWEVAAFEVADFDGNIHFLRVLNKMGHLRVSASTLPHKKLRGRKLKPQSEVSSFLYSLPPAQVISMVGVAGSLETEFKFPIRQAVAFRSLQGEFRIALLPG